MNFYTLQTSLSRPSSRTSTDEYFYYINELWNCFWLDLTLCGRIIFNMTRDGPD